MQSSRTESKRRSASRAHPCPVCGGNHKCSVGADDLIFCGRRHGEQPGFVYFGAAKADPQFGLYRADGDRHLPDREHHSSPQEHAEGNGATIDWAARTAQLARQLTPPRRRALAEALGLPEAALATLPIGYTLQGPHKDGRGESLGPCWAFPETDGGGKLIGITCRYQDHSKRAWPTGQRGLYLPAGWQERDGPILLPEGPSDTLALAALGLAAVGRPSNLGGVGLLAELLKDCPRERGVIVVGEFDPNEKGQWPGRDGAVKTAEDLASRLGRPVSWVLPPAGAKDSRAWVLAQQPDLTCPDQWADLGEGLLADLVERQQRVEAAGRSRPAFPLPLPLSQLQKRNADERWLWEGYLLRGGVTLFSALWKCGKSTLLGHLVKALAAGRVFCGQGTAPSRLLIVTEESPDLWADRRDRLGLADHCEVIPSPFLVKPAEADWQAFLVYLAGIQQERSFDLLVFDTLINLWSVRDENSAADVQSALMPLRQLLENAGLLLTTHFRKSGGEEATATRGSGALMGFADVILELRSYDAARPTDRRRVLTAKSRWDLTPAEVVIELDEQGQNYTAHGDRREVGRKEVADLLADVLPPQGPGLTLEGILAGWPESRKPTKKALLDTLGVGIDRGDYQRKGEGRRGSPFTYHT